ncbi:hypothetical protein JCM10212_004059 [Sporobolomyces blumeae]
MDVTAVVLFPLHVGVLAFLHVVFALIRLARVVLQLSPSLDARAPHHSPREDLAARRWTKVPKKLAVVLAPVDWRPGTKGDVGAKMDQVDKLVRWSRELGIEQLVVYDRQGVLVSHASRIAGLDAANSMVVKPIKGLRSLVKLMSAASPTPPKPDQVTNLPEEETASSDGMSGSTTLVSDGASTPKAAPDLTLILIARDAGRPQLARLAQDLAKARRAAGGERIPPLTSEKVAEMIDSFPLPEPDLLFVFGGPYLRLSGFPPWQIRLSEMYHHPTPAWLPSPTLSYSMLRSALDVYGRAEMRLGR